MTRGKENRLYGVSKYPLVRNASSREEPCRVHGTLGSHGKQSLHVFEEKKWRKVMSGRGEKFWLLSSTYLIRGQRRSASSYVVG